MTAGYFIELIIDERIGHIVEVVNYVGGAAEIDIHIDCAGNHVDPATDVQNARLIYRFGSLLPSKE